MERARSTWAQLMRMSSLACFSLSATALAFAGSGHEESEMPRSDCRWRLRACLIASSLAAMTAGGVRDAELIDTFSPVVVAAACSEAE